MNFKDQDPRVLIKQLARDVRRRLDAASRSDVVFDEHWVRFAKLPEGGHELTCVVPLGPTLQLPLKARESRADGDAHKMLTSFATELALALPNARRATAMLDRYIAGMRRAALREVKAARKLGADIQLAHVSLKPTYAWQLTLNSWRESANNVLALVGIRCLDLALRPEVDEFIVEEADDLASEISSRCEEQLELQARRADLRARGADLETDETTLRILGHLGLDATDLLRQAAVNQCVHMPVQDDERSGRLTLIASEGRVGSTLELAGLPRWTDGILVMHKDLLDPEQLPKPGYVIGPKAGLPIFRGLVVSEVQDFAGASVTLVHVSTRPVLFDDLTGRTWFDEQLAA